MIICLLCLIFVYFLYSLIRTARKKDLERLERQEAVFRQYMTGQKTLGNLVNLDDYHDQL